MNVPGSLQCLEIMYVGKSQSRIARFGIGSQNNHEGVCLCNDRRVVEWVATFSQELGPITPASKDIAQSVTELLESTASIEDWES